MKGIYRIGFILGLCTLVASTVVAKPDGPTSEQLEVVADAIKDGWYNATVEFRDSRSRGAKLYKLDVKVVSDRIVTIDFGDGRSVHTGPNDQGYTYRGGTVKAEENWTSRLVTLVTATVKVVTKDGDTLTFDIRIE